jgi:hypothetical protein
MKANDMEIKKYNKIDLYIQFYLNRNLSKIPFLKKGLSIYSIAFDYEASLDTMP